MRIRQRRRRSRAGFTVIEVTIALAILCSTVAVAGGGFLTNLSAVRSAQRTSAGALYLDTVMQDLSAQPYDSLLTFDGNSFHDQDTVERSNFRVQLGVFQAAVGLLQIQATLRDLRSGRELGKLTTLRSQR